jgi:hypothetical protein
MLDDDDCDKTASSDGTAAGAVSRAVAGSAWIPVSDPPAPFTRVIAKNDDETISDCVWLSKPEPGCYVIIPGVGAKRWKWATHYIPWPNNQPSGH